jgi:uncharacterized membrane protein
MMRQAKAKSRFRRFAAAAGLVLVVGVGACVATSDGGDRADELSARQLAAEGGRHHFRAPVKVVLDAALSLDDLSAEQEQILNAIEQELAEQGESHRAVGEELRTSAVAVVRSGSVDRLKLDQSLDQAMEVIEERMGDITDAVEEIHETLDAEQRARVADVLRERIANRFGQHHDHTRHEQGFKRFAAHLMLSALQIDELKALRKELLGERKHLRPSEAELLGLVDAFEGEDLRPALEAFQAGRLAIMRERMAEAGERADSVLSIFTPGQRELLADLIEQGPRKVLFGEEATEPSAE